MQPKWSRSCSLVVVLLVGCGGPTEREEPAVGIERQAARIPNSTTRITRNFPPGGSPGNMGLLPDGRVLCSGRETSNDWYTLTPDEFGSYGNGSWKQVASSHFGSVFGPSFILRDGTYFLCGGEYTNDPTELRLHPNGKDRAHCESFNPRTNLWTVAPDMPETVADTPAAELADGRVLNLSHASLNSYLYSAPNQLWTAKAPYPDKTVGTEGSCVLLPDTTVFCGMRAFVRYRADTNEWLTTADTPETALDEFSSSTHDEIGPLLLLHSGEVMVLGGNQKNGIYTPPTTLTGKGSWRLVANTPSSYNHGDAPSTVEVNGNLLTVVTTDPEGEGQPGSGDPSGSDGRVALLEYSLAGDFWATVLVPFGVTFGSGNRVRMLNLPRPGSPTAEVLIAPGMDDGTMIIYDSGQNPPSGARPTITSIVGPTGTGLYTLTGTQLNGRTGGAEVGDDGRMPTNFPIVSLNTADGHTYFARTSGYSTMAPTKDLAGSCNFFLPTTGLPSGTYQVRVTANGVDSSNTVPLSVSGAHITGFTGPVTGDIGSNVTWTVTLNQPAPLAGVLVNLASSVPSVATVPASVSIPFGAISTSVTVSVRGLGITNLTAGAASSQFQPVMAQFGWKLDQLTGLDVLYDQLGSATWQVGISQPAPNGGAVVNLAVDSSVVSIPSTVTIPAGSKTTTFGVSEGTGAGIATITGSVINSTRTHAVASPVQLQLGDMGFFKCSDEFSSCAIGSNRYMAFGITDPISRDQSYNFASAGGIVSCDRSVFGDPKAGAFKACYFSAYTRIGSENAALSLPSRRNVAYGFGTHFNFKDITGAFTCDNATFGDPSVGDSKACYAAPSQYDFMTTEGGSFSVNPQTPVAYGGKGRFVFKVMSGNVGCNNTTFGDPAPGAGKACYVFAPPYRVDEGQPFSITGLTALYYGSGTNGNFYGTSFLSGTCSNQFLGGDPDKTHFKHCYGL